MLKLLWMEMEMEMIRDGPCPDLRVIFTRPRWARSYGGTPFIGREAESDPMCFKCFLHPRAIGRGYALNTYPGNLSRSGRELNRAPTVNRHKVTCNCPLNYCSLMRLITY